MGGAPSPRIAQETLRRTPRICTRACRRVQVAQRLRSRASGANGLFCAYKAEDGGSSPSAPIIGDNDVRACYARLDNVGGRWVREKSVRFAARPNGR